MRKLKPSGKNTQLLRFLAYSLVGIIAVLLLKYHNQELELRNFKFSYPGNLIQLFIWLLSVVGVLIATNMRNPGKGISIENYKRLTFWGLVILIIGKIIMYINISSATYFLGQPLKKILVGGCYAGYEAIAVFTIAASWTSIYSVRNLYYLRSLVNTMLISLLLIVFTFVFTTPWYGNVSFDKANPYRYGVVLGAAVWSNNRPSPILVSRLDEAMNLYHAGILKKIYLTGSNAPGEITEAEAAFNYLKKYNIPLNDIELEKQTTSTTEQVRFLKYGLLKDSGGGKVLVISDKNHIRRIREIIRFYNIEVDVVGAELNLSYAKNLPYRFRESAALLIFWLFGL